MPWTTIAVVFGSWLLLLVLTLAYYLRWSRGRDGAGEGDGA